MSATPSAADAFSSLGNSGINVSRLGIGCNAFGARIDADATTAVVREALACGVTFFDTADIYGLGASEELLGQALRDVGAKRDQVVIATKFGMDMQGVNGDDGGRRGSREYVRTSIDLSLQRLGVDYIDLYQFHTPDPATDIAETLGALDELVTAGKVRAIGASNMQAWQMTDAHWVAKTAGYASFVTAQNEYSLYNRTAEVELTPACQALGISILPYFPLAYGLLTGKYRQGQDAPPGSRLALAAQAPRLQSAQWDRIDALQAYADERGVGLLDVAIGGLAAQPAVASVIAGVTRPEQVRANVAASRWAPSADDLEHLNRIGQPTMSYTTFAP